MNRVQKLPIGIQTLSKIREDDYLYSYMYQDDALKQIKERVCREISHFEEIYISSWYKF